MTRLVALATVLLACAPRAGAQSTMTLTWNTFLSGSPTAADFTAGRVILGWVNVSTSACARPSCRLQIFSTATVAASMRYVVSAGTPALNLCSNTLPTSQGAATTITTFTAATSLRVYICYELPWASTPPGSYSPAVTFRLVNN